MKMLRVNGPPGLLATHPLSLSLSDGLWCMAGQQLQEQPGVREDPLPTAIIHHPEALYPAMLHSLGKSKLLVFPGDVSMALSLSLSLLPVSESISVAMTFGPHPPGVGHISSRQPPITYGKHLWIQWSYWKVDDNGNYIRRHGFALLFFQPFPFFTSFCELIFSPPPARLPPPCSECSKTRKLPWCMQVWVCLWDSSLYSTWKIYHNSRLS